MAKVQKKLKNLLPALLLVVLLIGGVVYLKTRSSVIKVPAAKAESRTIAKTISASGETAVLTGYTNRALVSGSIKNIKFDSGAAVKKGEVVIELDQASLKASLDTAYSAYLGAKADMDSYDQKLAAAKATESIRKRERDEAWRTYMADNGETKKQSYKNAEALYQSAVSAVTVLETARKATQNAVYSGYSTYHAASANYANAVIKAPEDGILALANIYAGSYVTAGQELFSVTSPKSMIFRAEIDEADVSHMKVGMKAKVSLDSYPGEVFDGTVRTLDAKVATLSSGSAVVYADIAFTKEQVLPILGLSGSADIEFAKSEGIIAITPDALFEDAGKKYVYVVVANTLIKKPVEVGFEGDDYIGVVSGVSAGDIIVTGVADLKLKEGQKVSVLTEKS